MESTCESAGIIVVVVVVIIIMYISHALINALSAHMIPIIVNMIFYTHVEPAQFHPNNPHKAPYGKTPPHTHTHEQKHKQ